MCSSAMPVVVVSFRNYNYIENDIPANLDTLGFKTNMISKKKLLADDFARAGFKVVMPDLCEGDPLPQDFFIDVRLTVYAVVVVCQS